MMPRFRGSISIPHGLGSYGLHLDVHRARSEESVAADDIPRRDFPPENFQTTAPTLVRLYSICRHDRVVLEYNRTSVHSADVQLECRFAPRVAFIVADH